MKGMQEDRFLTTMSCGSSRGVALSLLQIFRPFTSFEKGFETTPAQACATRSLFS